MNEHISLVKKWLNDPDSVSQKELEDNDDAAADAAYTAAETAAAADAAADAAAAAAVAAAAAAADVAWAADNAYHWVERYEELS